MQISEETLAAGNNVVYEILDGGKVKDHSVQLGNEGMAMLAFGIDYMSFPMPCRKILRDGCFHLTLAISEDVDDNLRD